MRPLTSSRLLQVWEEGLCQSLTDKTLRLLGEACETREYASLSRMSIGERDARLLQLREELFGKKLHNMANCPFCKEITEWESNTADLHLQSLPVNLSVRTFTLEKDGYSVQFRLPDSNDLAQIVMSKKGEENYRTILMNCVLKVNREAKEIPAIELPDQIVEAINHQMSIEDPQADIRMNIQCPGCGYQWEARFDIISFLWAEINNWAQRMLREIYLLAKAFGWHEADILNMSARRRQSYLQMLGA